MNITVFSTKGRNRQVVESSATTWGELKSQLNDMDIKTSGMRAIIGETQVTLESSKAVLPVDFNFTLFLSPMKVKSGANVAELGYKDLKSTIKNIYHSSEEAEKHFGNYTIMSTDQLREVLEDWYDKKSEVLEISEETKSSKERILDKLSSILDKLEDVYDDIVDLDEDSVENEEEVINRLEESLNTILSNIND